VSYDKKLTCDFTEKFKMKVLSNLTNNINDFILNWSLPLKVLIRKSTETKTETDGTIRFSLML